MTLQLFAGELPKYALVFCRIGGMILFNPLLQRRNIPSQLKIALILGITLLLAPPLTVPEAANGLALLPAMVAELMVGVAFGFVFQIFYYLLFAAGDIIDMGFGLSMAKAFDPGTSLQVSVSGNLFQLMFTMYFFATNSHLILIRVMASSYDLIGPGLAHVGANAAQFLTTLFTSAFSLALHLALPFMAASFFMEIAMGVLMKLIPQINVFSINFQIKILLGMGLLFLFAGPVSTFLEQYLDTMLKSLPALLATMQ